MQNYQLTLILKPDLDEKDRKALLDVITKNFGKQIKEDIWGARDLIYTIRRQKKGFYAHFEFEAEPGTISSLDKMIKLNEDVIRYLLIRKD